MKFLFKTIAVAALLVVTGSAAAQSIIAPAPLKKGDKVAIISPSSTPKAGVAEAGAEAMRQWGFVPVIGKRVYGKHGMYSGTIAERLEDFMAALRDPSIKAIVCTRGGYGASLLLPDLPLDTLRKYNKWIVGYSDITSLHSAMVRSGCMSIHANMCGALKARGANDPLCLQLRDVLMGKRPTYTVPGHSLNHPGRAQGILVGGNMAVFSNLSGSATYDFLDRDFLVNKDVILFMEDVSESMPRVMSMLYQLKLKGALDRVKGIVIGRYTDFTPSDGYPDMPTLLDEYLQGYSIPICYDFPVSHDEDWNYPLIEGHRVSLNVSKNQVTLDFNH